MDASRYDDAHKGMRTSVLLSDPAYLRDLETMRRLNPWISLASRFNDTEWKFDMDAPCARAVNGVDWAGVAPKLAAELKLLVLRQGAAGPLGSGLSVDTCYLSAEGAVILGRWMTTERLRRLADLGSGGGDVFMLALADKVREIAELEPGEVPDGWDPRRGHLPFFGRGSRPAASTVRKIAGFILHARKHGEALQALGIRPLDKAPFLIGATGRQPANHRVGRKGKYDDGGMTPQRVADSFGDLKAQVKERLPDAVRFRMLDAFERLLGVPAEDNLRLIAKLTQLLATGMTEEEAIGRLAGFRFSTIRGEKAPWREPLPASGNGSVLRRLVRDVVGPASVIVLDATGVRPSEFVMLRGGRQRRPEIETRPPVAWHELLGLARDASSSPPVRRPATLPACVSETVSVSGLTVMVYLHGRVYKHQPRPTKAYWLLGSRQDDGPDPIAVRALDVLERLSRLLRPFAGKEDAGRLMLQISSDPDEPLLCAGMTVSRLQQNLGSSMAHHVDLAGIGSNDGIYDLRRYRDSKGRCVNLYQFRRTYVQLAYRTEPRLLIPLARQLQHEDSSVTKRAYVTSDPTLVRELEQAHSRETIAMFRELVEGKRRLGGAMGERIEEFAAGIAERVLALPTKDRDAAVARAFRVGEYRIHFLDDATCGIGLRPAAALCNRQTGRAGFKVDEPDLSVRDGTMCAGCAAGCFDRDRHGPSILRRYLNNMTSYSRQRLAGRGLQAGAWRRLAERDAALLTKLGLPFPTEEEILRGIG